MAEDEAGVNHMHPWLYSHDHSPYAWSVLGALAAQTRDVELVSLVTCPTIRYHPVIVAQKAATVAAMSGGRFHLGLGGGENLNEHVVGRGWPPPRVRHEMLEEAIDIMRSLWAGGFHSHEGKHFTADRARVFTRRTSPRRSRAAPTSIATPRRSANGRTQDSTMSRSCRWGTRSASSDRGPSCAPDFRTDRRSTRP